MQNDISDRFIPERVTARAKRMGLKPGFSIDLTNGWDLTKTAHRSEVARKVLEERPYLVIGSPPCTMLSNMQRMNWARMDAEQVKTRMAEAMTLLRYSAYIYKLQLDGGRYFLHEHPAGASSWKVGAMMNILEDPRVQEVKAHMCAHGMAQKDAEGQMQKVYKPTRFVTNSECIASVLDQQCTRDHAHISLERERTKAAQV